MSEAKEQPEPDRVPGHPHPRETTRLFGQLAAESSFLDAWSEWKRTHEDDALNRLCEATETLRQADPSFSFELPEA